MILLIPVTSVSNFLTLLKTRFKDGSTAVDIIDNKLVSAIRDAHDKVKVVSKIFQDFGMN